MPFIAYPLKATALFSKTAVRNPRTTRATQASSELWYDLAPEEEKARRDLAPKWRRGYTVPILGKDLNVRYLSPVDNIFLGGLFDVGGGNVDSQGGALINRFGGPLSPFIEVAVNRSFFFDRPIFEAHDSEEEAWKKATLHILSSMSSGTANAIVGKVWTAANAEKEGAGRGRRYTLTDAILAVAGVRTEEPGVRDEIRRIINEHSRINSEIEGDYRRAVKNQPRAKEKHRAEMLRKLQAERERFWRAKSPKLH